MTMNERLIACGLMGAFDAAIQKGDRGAFVAVLCEVALTKADAEAYADKHFQSLRNRL